jgi:hypothetical protein
MCGNTLVSQMSQDVCDIIPADSELTDEPRLVQLAFLQTVQKSWQFAVATEQRRDVFDRPHGWHNTAHAVDLRTLTAAFDGKTGSLV